MPARTYWVFDVVGRGRFPLDMLRYDACYPSDNDAVSAMDACFPYNGVKGEPGDKRVKLVSRSGPPEDRRWNSFGWKVGNVQKMLG